MNLPILTVSCFLLAIGNRALAQSGPDRTIRLQSDRPFLNLDFENATPYAMPLNWYIEAASAGVRVTVDSTHVHSGHRSLRVAAEGPAPVPIYTPLFLDQVCRQEQQARPVPARRPQDWPIGPGRR